MTPERWQQIDQLFKAVLACEPCQREEVLAAKCVDDEPLRREVESLLSSLEEADDFIEMPAGDVAAELLGTHRSTYEPGQEIQNYRIARQLGSGGMGEVYLADDIRLNRKVALKLLPPHFMVNPDRVRRFEREARAASALNHPNIVTIYEIGQSNSTHFIATEFVDGKTLRQLINEKPFTLNEALKVSMQVADALSEAHAAGIVHRDIKPENIMIRHDGYVKILDFGLAKLNEQQATEADLETPTLLQTNPGLVMGTVQYMSPEQARAKNVGVGTDIWSLGIVMYELLAGHVPFSGETPSHVMVSLMENKLPPLKDHANVPDDLDRFVTKALRKNQKERYQTAGQLARDLRGLKQTLQLDSRVSEWLKTVPSKKDGMKMPPLAPATTVNGAQATDTLPLQSHPTSSAEYLVSEVRRHKRGVMLAAAALLIAVVVAGYLYVSRSRLAAASEPIDSIAVLPFVNVANDANSEYLSDGISDSLITNLSQLPNLKKVIAFSSVARYKGKQPDPQAVGRELNVRAVLTGRLVQQGDDLLITAELVDVRDNRRLWGNQYNRKTADVQKFQGEIAQEIRAALRLKLSGVEQQRLAKSSSTNPEAYELYLRGRFYQRDRIGTREQAREYLEQAIEKDPNYAPAYAQLAYTYVGAVYSDSSNRMEAVERIKWAAQKALELDDTLGDAHAALAFTVADWSFRLREFQRALELDPNSADVHAHYARVLWSHRRIDEAIPHIKRAVELDPFSQALRVDLGKILYSAGQRDQAMEQYRKALEFNPNYGNAYKLLASYYLAEGRYEEAIAAAEKMSANVSDKTNGRAFLGYTYAVAGKRAEAEKILHELQAEAKQSHVGLETFALIYTGLGDKDRAFEFLQKEVEEIKILPLFFNVLPEWASLRTDPRFEALIQQSEWDRE
jgi:eukaryotic-like serine/threonine-protein kinase